MKILKIIGVILVVYVAIVAVFESLLGYFQPQGGSTLVITTTDEDGSSHGRVVAALEIEGQLYVAANHWPRAWYRQTLENPNVTVTRDGETRRYRAVPVGDEEYERVDDEHSLGLVFRILTGFPPRELLRLEPRP